MRPEELMLEAIKKLEDETFFTRNQMVLFLEPAFADKLYKSIAMRYEKVILDSMFPDSVSFKGCVFYGVKVHLRELFVDGLLLKGDYEDDRSTCILANNATGEMKVIKP